jgi:diguanylate cyclase (GGDEF)-like protein
MSKNLCTLQDSVNIDTVPITPNEYNDILNIQQELLSLTAYESDTQTILNKLCIMAEELLPNAVASLMLYNKSENYINVKAAPTIPPEGWDALNGIVPGPHSGSCGNAVYQGEPQYIINVLEDKRGTDFLETAKAFNLASCWSMPIKNEIHETIGSFALSSFEHRSPAQFHKKLLEVCSTIATIVLKSEKMAYYDSLTTLKNKVSLQKDINNTQFNTLIFLDVNNFSYINTAYSFRTGDEILLIIAQILQKLFNNENLYRIDSDQFAIMLPGEENISEIVDKVQKHFLDTTISTGNINLKISFNYGGVYSDSNLLKHAALAIKKAKEQGKNRLYIYDKKIDDSQKRASFIAMNNTIYEAFENDSIVPYFQGIYDNYQNKITKYEALVRIIKDNGEVVPPIEFLEVARLSGLIPKLTQVVIEKTFKFMSTNTFDFSINITEEDLNNQYLLEYLLEKSKEYTIEPYRVNLEILEGISATGKKDNVKQLKELKEYGFKVSIDDFGAEYSNFERVLELDVDIIKIDARYIKNIDKDKKSYEITKAIVNFAKNMQISLIAEFVHSKDVQEIIVELGIDYSQGFYFSEPAPILLS